jgi:hypothetical protein
VRAEARCSRSQLLARRVAETTPPPGNCSERNSTRRPERSADARPWRRRGWPGSSPNRPQTDRAAARADWKCREWRRGAAGLACSARLARSNYSDRSNRWDKMRRFRHSTARSDHLDGPCGPSLAWARTNRRSRPRRGARTGHQDQTASHHRHVLEMKKGSRRGAFGLRRRSAWGGSAPPMTADAGLGA